jgi:hypothetical protein
VALVLDPELLQSGGVWLDRGSDRPPLVVPARPVARDRAAADLPAVLLPPTTLERDGLRPRQVGTLVRVPGGVPPGARRRVEEALEVVRSQPQPSEPGLGDLAPLGLVTPGRSAGWEDGRLDAGSLVPDRAAVRRLAVSGFAAAVALIVVAVALTTVDRRRDDEVLVALGAPSGLRRRVGAVQAGVLAAVGAAVAVALGTGATAFGFATYNDAGTGLPPIPLVFPWAVAAVLLVALPLAAAGLTSLLTPTIRSVDLHRLAD